MYRRRLAALSALWLLSILGAHAAAPAPTAEDREVAKPYVGWIRAVLAVPDAADLDASLRASMKALVKEHLARMDKLVPEWVAEERARSGGKATRTDLVRQTGNRVANEFALWRLDSGGASYDAVYLKAILTPGICAMPARDNYLGRLMTWMQAVPAADRATLISGERELLSRWGKPRPALPARPTRSLSDDEEEAIARLNTGDAIPDVAMAPVVASAVFAAKREPLLADTLCALHQWGLARALRHGDPAAASLAAWRYETLMRADDWSDSRVQTESSTDYPVVATRNAVEAAIGVRVTTDAHGRFASGKVATRKLTVPGVVDEPAVAFETLFDSASLAQAASKFKPVPPAAGGHAQSTVITINWRLP